MQKKRFLIFAVCVALAGCESDVKYEEPSSETEWISSEETSYFDEEEASEKLLSWGMKRNLHAAPDFTAEQVSTMDKYGCIYKGSDEKKYLYLTFDEGYENGYTASILDTLKEKGVTAAFFITGDYFKRENELVERMVSEGHTVGNHTMNHPSLPGLDADSLSEEVLSLDRAFYEQFGTHMKYLRPPKGEYSEKTLAVTDNLGYVNVFWSFAYDDWDTKNVRGADYALQKTLENLHPGCVLLLHAVSKDNAEALGGIIDKARSEGYEFLPLDDYIK